jgi:DNA-binding HxlR family transcriptional regulator
MKTRSYNQLCGLSYALDAIGERWTMLIVREMIAGPRRYKDLIEGLPDISTNLLSERLKSLEHQGIIARRVLPPPAGSTVYELTALGQSLEPTLIALGRWGSQLVPDSVEGAHVLRAGSYALTLKTFFNAELAADMDARYALHIGNEILNVQIQAGTIHVQQASQPIGETQIYTDVPTYLGMLQGAISPETAVKQGLLKIEGDPAALRRLLDVCHIPASAAAA